MLHQAFTFATQGTPNATSTTDHEWPACLACAVADRARERSGTKRSGVCVNCFDRYCWDYNGTISNDAISNGAISNGAFRVGGKGVNELRVVVASWAMLVFVLFVWN
jgi:lysophospholipase